MWRRGALRGSPASTTRTLRRARDRTRAADRPAAPPPMITTSYLFMPQGWSRVRRSPTNVAVSGNRGSDEPRGGRLSGGHRRRARPGRGPAQAAPHAARLTLTGVAETTGISKSTLSRLETGQRRPTLELLLALSHAYRVPLDDLVAAPEEGDPRLRLKPGRVKGRTVIPLTRQPDGMQAWKIVIPTEQGHPRAARARRPRVDLRPVRSHAVRPRRPGRGPRAGRGRRVRHHGPALVRQHRRRARRDPQHLRATRRTDDDPRAD